MPRKLRLAYFAHTLRSDWNNGNAHFLRGLMRALQQAGHTVTVYEPECEWSIDNLREEAAGARSLAQFFATYPELDIQVYGTSNHEPLQQRLGGVDVVILHEWNPPALAHTLLHLRHELGFKLLFHDTHHRASSTPEEIERFGLRAFDGILAFGESLRAIYRERFGITRTWTLHEAADTNVFYPVPEVEREAALVWIGNWGEGERAREIRDFLLEPAKALRHTLRTTVYGVRYPENGLAALRDAAVQYGGYLPNLEAPAVYARAMATVHVPRRQYTQAMEGIPTIRVFEALACGIPLVSAPWQDTESLFRCGDFQFAQNTAEMIGVVSRLARDRSAAEDQAARGLETVLARHTCMHRAEELTLILEGVMA